MPELPEVETMCRGISPIVGGKVTDICVPRCKFRPIKISPRTAEIRKRAIGQPWWRSSASANGRSCDWTRVIALFLNHG